MAVTKIWPIRGRLDHSLNYVMNSRKTENKSFDPTGYSYSNSDMESLYDVMNYAMNDAKTEDRLFVTGIGCNPETARSEMIETKEYFGKTDGIIAYHMYQSFRPNETTPEIAHEIGVKLAKELFGDRFEAIVATHCNTDCPHNHILINSVSCIDGKRFYDQRKTVYEIRKVSDRLCREYGLSVIEKPSERSPGYVEWQAEKNGEPTKNNIIRQDMDECIAASVTVKQFYREMAIRGYSFNFDRKYPTIHHPNFPRPRRLQTLGDAYTPDAIAQRISGKWVSKPAPPLKQDDPEEVFFGGNRNDPNIFQNYRSVYVHFVCGLQVVYKRQPYNRELVRMLGDELIKFQKRAEEQNLMLDHDLYSDDDVKRYLGDLQTEVPELIAARQRFRNALKRAVRADDLPKQQEYKDEIALLTARLSLVRKQTKICERILAEEPAVEQHLRDVQNYTEQIKRKEEPPHEHIGRSGRTGRPNLYGRG